MWTGLSVGQRGAAPSVKQQGARFNKDNPTAAQSHSQNTQRTHWSESCRGQVGHNLTTRVHVPLCSWDQTETLQVKSNSTEFNWRLVLDEWEWMNKLTEYSWGHKCSGEYFPVWRLYFCMFHLLTPHVWICKSFVRIFFSCGFVVLWREETLTPSLSDALHCKTVCSAVVMTTDLFLWYKTIFLCWTMTKQPFHFILCTNNSTLDFQIVCSTCDKDEFSVPVLWK